MATNIHKGTELNNVKETWDANERLGDTGPVRTDGAATGSDDLEKVIREEAAEYDKENKEDRLLGGDRATVRDDE